MPMSRTQSPLNLSDVLDTFEPAVRAHLYDVLDQLGNGLQDRGAYLRQGFIDLAPFLRIAGRISAELSAHADYTRQLVHNAAVISSVLAGRDAQLHNLILAGTKSLDALSTAGGQALQQTLHELPPTLSALGPTLSDFDNLLPNLNRAIVGLGPVASRLPSALPELSRFAQKAEPAARALQVPVLKLVPLAEGLKPFSANLAQSMRALAPQTGYVDRITTDVSRCPYQLDEFFNWTQSVGKFYDAYGSYPRAAFAFGFYDLPGSKVGSTPVKQCSGGSLPIGGIPTILPPGPTGNQ